LIYLYTYSLTLSRCKDRGHHLEVFGDMLYSLDLGKLTLVPRLGDVPLGDVPRFLDRLFLL
jgi:hypothetical protein